MPSILQVSYAADISAGRSGKTNLHSFLECQVVTDLDGPRHHGVGLGKLLTRRGVVQEDLQRARRLAQQSVAS